MAETDPVAEQQAERPERNNEPIVYDESLLILVKGKVQQPKQPEHTESRLLIQKLQAEITKRGDRIKEIKTIEEQLRSNAKGASSGNKEVIGKLKELRDQRGTIIRQKAAIRDELNNCDAARDAVRAEMRSIRDKNRNVNPDKIEQDIRDMEFKLTHESLPEQEEKRVQTQLQQLIAARPTAKKHAEYDARLKEGELQRANIIGRLKESDGVIAQLDVQITAASSVLDEAKAKSDAHAADLPSLQVEKKENYEIMVALRSKIDELRKSNDQEYQDFIKRDRAYRGWKREQNRKKYEERQKEREEREQMRQDETKAIMGEVVVEPFNKEIFTCDQLLTYLRSFTAVKEEVKEEVKAVEVPAGLKPFKRTEVVDEMFSGVPKRAPQSKGGKAAPAPAPKPVEAPKPKITKLNHTLDMLKVFLQLQVEPPTTTSSIPTTIEKVEARKEEYKVKQEEAKRAPPPPRAPAANGSHKRKEAEPDEEPEEASAAEEEEEEAQEPETPSESEAPSAAPEPEAPSATPEPEAPSAAPEAEEPPVATEPEAPSVASEPEAPSAAPEAEQAASAAPVEAEEPSAVPTAVEPEVEEPSSSAAAEVDEPAPASEAASEPEAAAAEPAANGDKEKAEADGVDVELKVDGNKVSVSVTAS